MPDDPISDLRAHVDAAHAAADRLVQEANARAAAAEAASREQTRDVPPHGWDVPPSSDDDPSAITPDLAAIMALLESVRGVVPDDISAQLAQALRDLLLALRALIDWYVERLEGLGEARAPAQKPVEDVPIL